jgi:hypothetical protein
MMWIARYNPNSSVCFDAVDYVLVEILGRPPAGAAIITATKTSPNQILPMLPSVSNAQRL